MTSNMNADSWRIVLFTDLPPMAVMYGRFLASKGHRIAGVVTSRKRNFGYVEVVKAAPAEADVLVSDRPRRWARMLAPLKPDLIIASVFPWRIPQEVIDLPRLGAINLHPSLLPKYRGTMTPNWTLLNGETKAGMTVHRMVADFDAGPILAQVSTEIDDDDDIQSYLRRLFGQAPALLEAALARVAAGDPGDPQDESEASYFGQIPAEERVIDWSSPARRIHNQVRAFSGAVTPVGAFGTVEGVPSRVIRTRLIAGQGDGVAPGTIVARGAEGLTIQCGDGAILVVEHAPVDSEPELPS